MSGNAKAEIIRLATALLRGEMDIVEGCALLVRQFGDAGLRDDPDALIIVGVESSTDDLPVGSARALWDPAALAAKMAEKAGYIEGVCPMVLEACQALVTKLCTVQ